MAMSNSERCKLWRKNNPEKYKRDCQRRRFRRDNRAPTLWHKRLILLRLHCGEFSRRKKDAYYDHIEVRLDVFDLAMIWFRDKAWTMKKPHLDRVDPDGHYEFDNVRFIEEKDNLARRRKSKDEEVPF